MSNNNYFLSRENIVSLFAKIKNSLGLIAFKNKISSNDLDGTISYNHTLHLDEDGVLRLKSTKNE